MDEGRAFRKLNLSVFFHFVGRQSYSIFVPVILLKNGYSLTLVISFLLLSSLVTIITSYLGQKALKGRNVINFNILAVLAEISLLLMLLKSGFSTTVFLLIILFEGLYYSFYYLSYFALTVHYTSKEKTGSHLGNLTITVALASIIGPILGSYILADSTFLLVATSITALLISLIPLLKIARPEVEEVSSDNIKISDIKKELLNYGVMASFEVVLFTLWGVYAYISDFALLNIGLIVVATSISRILLSYWIKDDLVKDRFRKTVMAVTAIGIVFTSIYRFYIPEQIVLTNFLMSLFYVGFQLSAQTAIINKCKGSRTYYSSMLFQATSFSIRAPIYILVLIFSLRTIILLPVLTGLVYLFFNSSSLYETKDFISTKIQTEVTPV